ncbi:MAG: hypothetical protein ACK4SY_05925 [Pyrobaculum sp.]
MSILRRKREEDELEKILSQIRDTEKNCETVVTIQIAGLKELVEAIEKLAETLKRG